MLECFASWWIIVEPSQVISFWHRLFMFYFINELVEAYAQNWCEEMLIKPDLRGSLKYDIYAIS